MAKTPSTDTTIQDNQTSGQYRDPDDFPTAPITRVDPAAVDAKASRVAEPAELTLTERIDRIEKLAHMYFGAHHFEAPAPVFNPDAERDSARARFQQEMERIENEARKPN